MIPAGITLKSLIVYLIIMNILSFSLFAVDKRRAQTGSWRIEERNLFLSAILGGSLGGWIGMYVCHHKTRHLKFKIGMPLILLLQVLLILYWLRI